MFVGLDIIDSGYRVYNIYGRVYVEKQYIKGVISNKDFYV